MSTRSESVGNAARELHDPMNGFLYTLQHFSDKAFFDLMAKGRTPVDRLVDSPQECLSKGLVPSHPIVQQEMGAFLATECYWKPGSSWLEVALEALDAIRHVCVHVVHNDIANNAMLKSGSAVHRYHRDVIPPLVACLIYNYAYGAFRWSQKALEVPFIMRAKHTWQNQLVHFLFIRPVLYYTVKYLDINKAIMPTKLLASGAMHTEKSLVRRLNTWGVWSQELVSEMLHGQNGRSFRSETDDKCCCRGLEYQHARVVVLFASGIKLDAGKQVYMHAAQLRTFGSPWAIMQQTRDMP